MRHQVAASKVFFLVAIVWSHVFCDNVARGAHETRPRSNRKSKLKTIVEDPDNSTLPWGPKELYPFDIDKALKQCKIVPNIIDTSPQHIIQVLYEDETVVDFGVYLRPEEMWFQPKMIEWPDEKGHYYTLIVADPDIPTRIDDTGKEFLYWLVVNVHNISWKAEDIIAPYIGPEPAVESGVHRVLYLVYKQPNKMQFNEPRLGEDRSDHRRANFIVRNFAKKYKLGEPYAINFFFCENWDFPNDDDHPLAGHADGWHLSDEQPLHKNGTVSEL